MLLFPCRSAAEYSRQMCIVWHAADSLSFFVICYNVWLVQIMSLSKSLFGRMVLESVFNLLDADGVKLFLCRDSFCMVLVLCIQCLHVSQRNCYGSPGRAVGISGRDRLRHGVGHAVFGGWSGAAALCACARNRARKFFHLKLRTKNLGAR